MTTTSSSFSRYSSSKNRDYTYLIICILFFLLIFFLLPKSVETAHVPWRSTQDLSLTVNIWNNQQQICNGRGYIDLKTGLCNCISNWHGNDCSLRYCPYGKSWISPPQVNHQRYRPRVECSNMGTCDILTGKCKCRSGYEGRACERKSCPTSNHLTCSGHGRCLTMRELSQDFNGLTTISPSIEYNGWDADALMGCVCDDGYEGYDCSLRKCPWGVDPTSTVTSNYEKFVIRCKADAGYFSLTVLGRVSDPIPHNATPSLLHYILSRIPNAKSVRVSTPVLSGDQQPSICGNTKFVETALWFEDYIGARPPIRISYGDTANTRLFPDGSTTLSFRGSTPYLKMATKYTLTCPRCYGACKGTMYFKYRDTISTGVDITASGATGLVKSALQSLTDMNTQFPDITYSVTSTGSPTLCRSGNSAIFSIILLSNYGNIPPISILDSTLYSATVDVPLNITLQSDHGSGSLAECSNQGLCNHATGICSCIEKWTGGMTEYRALSSDGAGGLGSRGDCGYLDITTNICPSIGADNCNGHGFCSVINEPCLCYDGWYGYNCQFATCPKGRSWFDEAISTTEAHQLTECSSMGHCDRSTGLCNCRSGYSGSACQYLDCPYDSSTGSFCGGNGWCLSMSDYSYQTSGLSYGIEGSIRSYPDAWDAFMFHACLCSAYTPGDVYVGHPLYPPIASNGIISGKPVETRNLPGYTGYNCHSRLCPFGPKVTSGRTVPGNLEVQRVQCIGTSAKSFTLTFNEIWNSNTITGDMTSEEIKEAIEWIPVLGNISIEFRNSDNDGVIRACNTTLNTTYGGFYITFLDDLGDIPILTTVDGGITIDPITDGSIEVAECGGTSGGYCNRETGKCQCYSSYTSSNGTNAPGRRGDCSYFNPHPIDSSIKNTP